jgi:hypothetical protein
MTNDEKLRLEVASFLDNLINFLADDNRSKEQVNDDLRARNIDSEATLTEFRNLLSQYAPTWQEQAQRGRRLALEALESVRNKGPQTPEQVKTEINAIVESMRVLGVPVEAGAFHRNFQEAEDEDLESLLVDLMLQWDLLQPEKGSNT